MEDARDVGGQREEAQNPDYSWALRADGPFQEVAGGEVGQIRWGLGCQARSLDLLTSGM